ncbi:MAG: DUF814 domain-containing protein [Nitrospinae bacterium]|nr:DUF814 domain-containing protein [Nitrospinota bacterium]
MTETSANDLFEEKKSKMLSAARARLKKIQRLLKALEGDRQKLSAFEHCKRWGDVCQTHFKELKKGMTQIRLTDPLNGEELLIPLFPELGAAQNIAALYKKHRKFRTGMEKTAELAASAAEKAEREKRLISAIENAESDADLDAMAVSEGAPQAAPPEPEAKKKADKAFAGFRRFYSADGFEMIVGRNDAQNDDLVRHSNGNDLWFHIRDFPGSHVVVRTAKKKEVPLETIREAARLALKHSTKARDGKGTVVYTHVKDLRRPKNAPPGRVLVTREKTLQVRIG